MSKQKKFSERLPAMCEEFYPMVKGEMIEKALAKFKEVDPKMDDDFFEEMRTEMMDPESTAGKSLEEEFRKAALHASVIQEIEILNDRLEKLENPNEQE